ncbi:MAG: hypothetical protein NVV83_00350 [Afipia sp.]|nr:hypothetical protein [Afipia sp.]
MKWINEHHELKKLKLFFLVAGLVVAISAVKVFVHWMQFEFVTLSTLLTSAIGGAIFIIGFLLSGVLSDYKESERLPADIRVALEALHDDAVCFAEKCPDFKVGPLRMILGNILIVLQRGLGHEGAHKDLRPAILEIDKLTPMIAQMDILGMPANFIVRLRGQQDQLRRCVFRIYHIQSMQFVPSVYILVKTLVAAIVMLLLFLETEGSPGTALIFGFISYMFVYALYLIETLEQPFRKDHDSLDDVSLFLLREFGDKLDGYKDENLVNRPVAGP